MTLSQQRQRYLTDINITLSQRRRYPTNANANTDAMPPTTSLPDKRRYAIPMTMTPSNHQRSLCAELTLSPQQKAAPQLRYQDLLLAAPHQKST